MHAAQTLLASGKRSWPSWLVVASLAAVLLSGCSGSAPSAVDDGQARDTLKTALDGWKKGDSPSALKEASPSIIVQDLDWINGDKLVDYQLDGDSKTREANLYIPVKLTIKRGQGKEVKKSVSYIVSTNPTHTVFRAFN